MGHRKRGFPMFPPDLFPPEEEFESSSSSEESGAESGEEEGEPATLAEALRRALDAAPPPGEFTTGGELSAQQPGLELFDSNGSADVVGLPLSAATEAAIKASCQPAPARGRGRGKKSKVAQAQFTSFRLTNPKWQEAVDKVLAECREALGLADVAVNAQLHKLVLYESGSSYSLPHTEQEATQAADCTWGTLYIQLPSAYQGGRLVVSHGGSSKAFDFAANSAFGTHYAALFADCEHEVEAVTGGRFLALVYNLVCKDSSKRPRPPDRASAMAAVRAVVQRWEDELQADESTTPCKLVYALENVYYDDEETGGLQGNLVGADRSTSHMLAALQAEGLLDVHLGSVEWDEFGYPGKYARSQPRIKKWLSLDNQRVFGWDTMDLFSETELCQGADYLKTLKPYHVEEGRNRWAPRTREYEFTAFVVWPSSRHYAMLCMDSLACAAGGLRRAAQQRSKPPAALQEWAAAVLHALPDCSGRRELRVVLDAFVELGDARLAEQCLEALPWAGSEDGQTNNTGFLVLVVEAEEATAIIRLCQISGWSAQCASAMQAMLSYLVTRGMYGVSGCVAILRQLHAAATPPAQAGPAAAVEAGAEAAGATTSGAAAAVAAAAAAATTVPTAGQPYSSSSSMDHAAAAALLAASAACVTSKTADLRRLDAALTTPTSSFRQFHERRQEGQGRLAAALTDLLSFFEEVGDEALLRSFLSTGFARHFIAANVNTHWKGNGGMLAALLAACQRYGWGSSDTAAMLSATAAACAGTPAGSGDFLELAKGVQAAAGQAANALLPQLTAAFLQMLPNTPCPSRYDTWSEEILWVQALLDWLAQHGSLEHFGTYFAQAARITLSLEAAVDRALRDCQANGWWAEMQQGLVAAFGGAFLEDQLPSAVQQLRRVRQATGVDGDAAANGDSRRRYAEVAGALVSAMERERSIQLRTAQFVQDLFQAIYVPGCTESAQVLARAAAHVCRCPLRYPAARVVLPALEGFAQQLQLGSLAAAVQAEPALRLMVQHAADALQARVPPVEPVEWSKSGLAQCRYEGCSECAAVRAFLQDAQQSQQHIKMTYLRRRHMECVLRDASSAMRSKGISWQEDGTGMVFSKRGAYEAMLEEHNKAIAAGQQLQAMLACGVATQPANDGGTSSAAAQQPAEPPQPPQQQRTDASGAADRTGGSRTAKRRRR